MTWVVVEGLVLSRAPTCLLTGYTETLNSASFHYGSNEVQPGCLTTDVLKSCSDCQVNQ